MMKKQRSIVKVSQFEAIGVKTMENKDQALNPAKLTFYFGCLNKGQSSFLDINCKDGKFYRIEVRKSLKIFGQQEEKTVRIDERDEQGSYLITFENNHQKSVFLQEINKIKDPFQNKEENNDLKETQVEGMGMGLNSIAIIRKKKKEKQELSKQQIKNYSESLVKLMKESEKGNIFNSKENKNFVYQMFTTPLKLQIFLKMFVNPNYEMILREVKKGSKMMSFPETKKMTKSLKLIIFLLRNRMCEKNSAKGLLLDSSNHFQLGIYEHANYFKLFQKMQIPQEKACAEKTYKFLWHFFHYYLPDHSKRYPVNNFFKNLYEGDSNFIRTILKELEQNHTQILTLLSIFGGMNQNHFASFLFKDYLSNFESSLHFKICQLFIKCRNDEKLEKQIILIYLNMTPYSSTNLNKRYKLLEEFLHYVESRDVKKLLHALFWLFDNQKSSSKYADCLQFILKLRFLGKIEMQMYQKVKHREFFIMIGKLLINLSTKYNTLALKFQNKVFLTPQEELEDLKLFTKLKEVFVQLQQTNIPMLFFEFLIQNNRRENVFSGVALNLSKIIAQTEVFVFFKSFLKKLKQKVDRIHLNNPNLRALSKNISIFRLNQESEYYQKSQITVEQEGGPQDDENHYKGRKIIHRSQSQEIKRNNKN